LRAKRGNPADKKIKTGWVLTGQSPSERQIKKGIKPMTKERIFRRAESNEVSELDYVRAKKGGSAGEARSCPRERKIQDRKVLR